jgi:carotenoid cleavage dioxygenase
MAAEPDHGEIYRFDLDDGARRDTHRFPAGHTCGEPVFVDGVLLTFAHDRGRGTSYLAILDADDLPAEPLAEIHVPTRVPAGFHGSWVPD